MNDTDQLVGKNVFYKSETHGVVPAIITKVEGDAVTLTVFTPDDVLSGVVSLNRAGGPEKAKDRNWFSPNSIQ